MNSCLITLADLEFACQIPHTSMYKLDSQDGTGGGLVCSHFLSGLRLSQPYPRGSAVVSALSVSQQGVRWWPSPAVRTMRNAAPHSATPLHNVQNSHLNLDLACASHDVLQDPRRRTCCGALRICSRLVFRPIRCGSGGPNVGPYRGAACLPMLCPCGFASNPWTDWSADVPWPMGKHCTRMHS